MPINETKKRSLVESNYINGNGRFTNRRDNNNFVTLASNGRHSIVSNKKMPPSSSRSSNNLVISCENMFLQDITVRTCSSRKTLHNGSGCRYTSGGLAARNGDSISLYSQESYRSQTSRLRGGKYM